MVTVSRAAADRVNGVVLNNVFTRSSAITDIPCDSGTNTFQVYQGMQVMITQNRDKKVGVINGQAATVINAKNRTVHLKLSNGHTVFTHPITYVDQQGQRLTTYPFTPSYAMTICKSQGATLEKLLLWLDCTFICRPFTCPSKRRHFFFNADVSSTTPTSGHDNLNSPRNT
ncbi:hypothetical protein OS493_038301 [Desmophyllum pertusum]|uniref:Uncharacterized protein n=1 Tax=Desmophyllum pertusum TaxID=174260 RepID=A0A9W9Z6F5_9CNID|nr:hypothetical protein OS493_038299 [Desmophyllum pertusum]KAJ7375877.1 hypothetical protein OS493_038301 [Desmophyllum pertusum]